MTDTFAFAPTGQPNGGVTFRLRTAAFGDGYAQIVGDGINVKSGSWPMTFAGTKAEMQAVVDFFDAHAGVSFNWTPPIGSAGLYVVKSYSVIPQGGQVYSVTATFEQWFSP